jgi:transposase-like protein
VAYAAPAMGPSFLDAFVRQYVEVYGDVRDRAKNLHPYVTGIGPGRHRVPDQFPDGSYSTAGVAHRFGISQARVGSWVRRGVLPYTVRTFGGHMRVRSFELTPAIITQVKSRVRTMRAPKLNATWEKLKYEKLPDRFPDGRYSLRGVCKRFGVGPDTVFRWIRRKLLRGEHHDFRHHHRVWWFEIPESLAKSLDHRSTVWKRWAAR